MNVTTKDLIIAYREEGLSYREIAEKTGVSEQYARVVWSKANKYHLSSKQHSDMCRYCGKQLVNTPGGRQKEFCNEKCRSDYHNQLKAKKAYIRSCEHCGKEFVSYGYPMKRFCSRECQTTGMKKARENREDFAV